MIRILTCACHPNQPNAWPNSSVSCVVNYSHLFACQRDIEPLEDDTTIVWWWKVCLAVVCGKVGFFSNLVTYTAAHTCIHMHMYTHTYTCTHMRAHTHARAHTHTYTHTHTQNVHITHWYMYTCIHISTHTNMHTHACSAYMYMSHMHTRIKIMSIMACCLKVYELQIVVGFVYLQLSTLYA